MTHQHAIDPESPFFKGAYTEHFVFGIMGQSKKTCRCDDPECGGTFIVEIAVLTPVLLGDVSAGLIASEVWARIAEEVVEDEG
jgi:hypothetical protein